jgi:5-oxoprolinase (ATP-hydrolysing) subunit A
MNTIDLNCDMGEGFNTDALIMPYISSANIACGYHAGDESIMQQTVSLAIQHNVAIGAHPGFADKTNFGRTDIHLPLKEVYHLITTQIQLLQKITKSNGTKLHHVKPHGALYNMSAKDPALANMIAKAVYDNDSRLILFGLSGSHSIIEAKKIGLITAGEVFADRTYQNTGSLTPRSHDNAFITNESASIQQVLQMIQSQTVTSVDMQIVPIVAETICLHGDGVYAVKFAKAIHQTLEQHYITIQSINH